MGVLTESSPVTVFNRITYINETQENMQPTAPKGLKKMNGGERIRKTTAVRKPNIAQSEDYVAMSDERIGNAEEKL